MSKIELFCRACIFWPLHALSLILVVSVLLLTFPFNVKTRYRVGSSWAKFNAVLLRHVCNLNYNVEGMENIPNGAAIALSKHQSTCETLLLQAILPQQHWVMKRELMYVPIFGWGAALLGSIAIDRSAGRKAMDQLVQRSKQKLDAGGWVIIFPEGTRIKPGNRQRYKLGGAVLASQVNYPALPIAHNAGEFWPKHHFFIYPGVITFRIGKPMLCKDRKPEDVMREVEEWIENQVSEISDPARWNR